MDNNIHPIKAKPEYWIRPGIEFESYFNSNVPSDKIRFARHYVETKMGYDLDEDSLIDFSNIGIKLFGSMLVDVIIEYEKFNGTRMDG